MTVLLLNPVFILFQKVRSRALVVKSLQQTWILGEEIDLVSWKYIFWTNRFIHVIIHLVLLFNLFWAIICLFWLVNILSWMFDRTDLPIFSLFGFKDASRAIIEVPYIFIFINFSKFLQEFPILYLDVYNLFIFHQLWLQFATLSCIKRTIDLIIIIKFGLWLTHRIA